MPGPSAPALQSPDPITWHQIGQAVREWVITSSGYASERVIYEMQTGRRPSSPFCSVKLGDLTTVAVADEQIPIYDAGRPAGQELELRSNGLRVLEVVLHFFTDSAAEDGEARAVLEGVRTALSLESVREALRQVGLSCFDRGRVQEISALIGARWESRAVCTFRFYTRVSASDYTTWIESVVATSYLGPPDSGTVDAIDIP